LTPIFNLIYYLENFRIDLAARAGNMKIVLKPMMVQNMNGLPFHPIEMKGFSIVRSFRLPVISSRQKTVN